MLFGCTVTLEVFRKANVQLGRKSGETRERQSPDWQWADAVPEIGVPA
jgi:hypothetical protein